MARRKSLPPLRTRGGAWGKERVRLGISLRQLSAASGINRGTLSFIESGRLNPTGDEFDRVMAVLRDAEARQSSEGGAPGASTAPE